MKQVHFIMELNNQRRLRGSLLTEVDTAEQYIDALQEVGHDCMAEFLLRDEFDLKTKLGEIMQRLANERRVTKQDSEPVQKETVLGAKIQAVDESEELSIQSEQVSSSVSAQTTRQQQEHTQRKTNYRSRHASDYPLTLHIKKCKRRTWRDGEATTTDNSDGKL